MTRMTLYSIVVSLAGACAPLAPQSSERAALSTNITQVTTFGANPGGLRMWTYVPQNMPASAPLVLALHACTEQAADYVKAGWNDLADQYKFYVVYPEQTSTNNGLDCFNWAGVYGNPANLQRGMGENESIKEMVDYMKTTYSIDASRVFITGQSAGGAQVALMLAVWPDVFAAGAPIAGIPYHCTTQLAQVSTCLNPGITMTPQQWGDFVRQGDTGYSGPWPRLSIWQGTKDSVVNPSNEDEMIKQWTNAHGISQMPSSSSQVNGNTRELYTDSNNKVVIEAWRITGMDHGVPVDAKNGCGQAGSYFLDVGVCSSRYIAQFFGIVPSNAVSDGGVTTTGYDGGSCSLPCGNSDLGSGNGNGNGNGSGSGSNGSGSGSGNGSHPLPCKANGCSVSGSGGMDAALVLMVAIAIAIQSRRRSNSRRG